MCIARLNVEFFPECGEHEVEPANEAQSVCGALHSAEAHAERTDEERGQED